MKMQIPTVLLYRHTMKKLFKRSWRKKIEDIKNVRLFMSSGRLFQYFWVGATEIVIPMSYFFGCEVSHTNMYTHRAEGSSIAEILIVLQQNKYYGTRTACFKIDSITPELNGIENKTAIIYFTCRWSFSRPSCLSIFFSMSSGHCERL